VTPPWQKGDPWWTLSGWSNHIATDWHQKNARAAEKKQKSCLPKSPLHTTGPSILVAPSVSTEEYFDDGIFNNL